VEDQGRIRLLPPEEAKKIAAGEVIDRPAALVREFLDNAIDAGARLIEVVIEEGGLRRIEVIDDGCGMDRENLELCCQPHATSKIRSLEDLNTARTLGFRGEALAAALAAARVEILTSVDGREGWRLEAGPGGTVPPRVEPGRRAKGTSVRALGLFDAIPARKRFLKREGGEAGLCKQAFIDKALAFPELTFRFVQDGKLKIFLPAVSSLKERFGALLLDRNEGAFLHEIGASGPGFSVTLVAGGPELFRQDRRRQYVFANGRRIQDYALLQALEYGLQGWFPNGAHPVGGVYVTVDPKLADFNVHPAKREVRFADPGAVHHGITSALRDFTRHWNISFQEAERTGKPLPETGGFREARLFDERDFAPYRDGGASGGTGAFPSFRDREKAGALAMEALLTHPPDFASLPGRESAAAEQAPPYGEEALPGNGEAPGDQAPRYVGRLFNLFILVEWGKKFFIIDQHAAHERILFDRFLREGVPKQELLVAIPFSAESDEEDRFLLSRKEELASLGIVIEAEGGAWRVEALPVNWPLGDAETVREILDLRLAGENIAERWAATLSCHGAVKDGTYLDNAAALSLAEAALKLPVSRCPHGRPIWFEISREDLFRAVRRL
jgi:DNA mismatch repair protein MutL